MENSKFKHIRRYLIHACKQSYKTENQANFLEYKKEHREIIL